MSSLSAEPPIIVAHRGASAEAPENTLAAFRLAWQMNADAIEGDFHLTSDNQIVCIHDGDTGRVAPQSKPMQIANSTLQELRTLDVGHWKNAKYAGEPIPLLEEVLQTVALGNILIEIKCGPEILPQLQSLLSRSKLNDDQITIISFDPAVIAGSRKSMPQYKANWLTSFKRSRLTGSISPSLPQVLETLAEIGATGLGAKADFRVIDDGYVQQIRDAGFAVHLWTIDDPDEVLRAAALGVDSITTNAPDRTRGILTAKPLDSTD